MTLTYLEFDGYKSFTEGNPQRLDLAPLTLLFGKNGAGKSAALEVLRYTLTRLTDEISTVLPFSFDPYDSCKATKILNLNLRFELESDYDFTEVVARVEVGPESSWMKTSATTGDNPPAVWVAGGNTTHTGSLLPPGMDEYHRRHAAALGSKRLVFDEPKWDAGDADFAIGRLDDGYPHFTGYTAMGWLLSYDDVAAAVSAWSKEYLGYDFVIVQNSVCPSFARPVIRDGLPQRHPYETPTAPRILHLAAMSACCQSHPPEETSIRTLDQPEQGLHPSLHAPLADLLIDIATAGKTKMVVETHSENLILRIRRRIAEGKIKGSDVALVYVEKTEKGSTLRRISLDDAGEVAEWPDGIFDDGFKEVKAIRRAQIAREQASTANLPR